MSHMSTEYYTLRIVGDESLMLYDLYADLRAKVNTIQNTHPNNPIQMFLSPDRSPDERTQHRQLILHLKQKVA